MEIRTKKLSLFHKMLSLRMPVIVLGILFILQPNISDGKYNNAKSTDDDKVHQNDIHQHRYRREITPAANSTDKLDNSTQSLIMVEQQLDNLPKKKGEETKKPLRDNKVHQILQKLENSTRSINFVRQQLDNLQKMVEEEAEQRLPDDIVRHLQFGEFALAEEKLQKAKNGTIAYVVKKAYDHQAANFELVLGFGGYVRDVDQKWKIYDALYREMTISSGHDDKGIKLLIGDRIKKEILKQTKGVTAVEAKSLYNIIYCYEYEGVSQEETAGKIVASIQNNESAIHLCGGGCYQCKVDIFKRAIEKLWNKLSIVDIFERMRNSLRLLDVQIAFQVAAFHLFDEQAKKLYTNNSTILARHVKSTMDRADYHSASLEMRTQHEEIVKKLPKSVKNLVFSSAVCLKNYEYQTYVRVGNKTEFDMERSYNGVPYEYRPRVVTETLEFGENINGTSDNDALKWRVHFVDNNLTVQLENVKFGDTLYVADCDYELNHCPFGRILFALNEPIRHWRCTSGDCNWEIRVHEDLVSLNHVSYTRWGPRPQLGFVVSYNSTYVSGSSLRTYQIEYPLSEYALPFFYVPCVYDPRDNEKWEIVDCS